MACGGGILERGGEGSGRYARKAKTDTRCDFGAGGGGGQTKNELVQLDLFTLTHLIFSHGARRPDLPAVVVGRQYHAVPKLADTVRVDVSRVGIPILTLRPLVGI